MKFKLEVAASAGIRRRLAELSAATLLAGCVAAPVSEADRAKIRNVVIAVADFPPEVRMRIQSNGGSGGPQTGSESAVSRVQAAVEEDVTRRLQARDLREPLIAALRGELTAGGFESSVMPRSEVNTDATSSKAYRLQAPGVDAVLEVSMRSIGMQGSGPLQIMTAGSNELLASLAANAQTRLIDARDARVLGDFTAGYFSGFAPLEDWVAGHNGQTDRALEQMNRRFAADIVDRALREYLPPLPEAFYSVSVPADAPEMAHPPGALSPYRVQALRPVTLRPARRNTFYDSRLRYGAMAAFVVVTADSVSPTLEWERFPRGYSWAPENADAARISGVTYEIRLYNAARQYASGSASNFIQPERVVYERTGLAQPIHRPEQLEPCSAYFWTARARFTLDGRVRVTPWMSVGPWLGPIAFVTPQAADKKAQCSYDK